MSELFAPVCSITTTKRRRFFWAAWWSGPPERVPFKKPDASDGGAATRDEALAAAEKRAGASLVVIDALWARAWIRILRGEPAWPSKASREPGGGASRGVGASGAESGSIWELLGVSRDATESELKAAFRKRALETHPDQGGDGESFRRLLQAHEEAQRRLRKPRPRRPQ
ncbi:MAG TPA: DnaJ domain-containing protein [Labilithrix sp.]|nr:DnaJ domain-containing protein [Labilithrix sp.]